MDNIKSNLKIVGRYGRTFGLWIALALLIGAVSGVLGSLFHICIDYVTELRVENGTLILLLPLGGVVIAFLYRLCKNKGKLDTNRVIEAVRENEKVPFVMLPLIFISTVLTHLLGGSAGREGAALQLGGSLGYNIGRLFRIPRKQIRILIMSGMSGVFAALFGTPITAAVFSIEVTDVGEVDHVGLLPCTVSALAAYGISQRFGLTGVHFDGIGAEAFTLFAFGKIGILALLCAFVSILFCVSIKGSERVMERYLPNGYIRVFAGGLLIVVLTALVRNQDYNGAGMGVIEQALYGTVKKEAFLLKILFTAITIAAGFKGGEIVPAFFIGATFGCAAGPFLGLDPSFAAAVAMVTLFCCVVNCPMASIVLSLEVFGSSGLMFFALAVVIGTMMSGYFGLYHSQKFIYSKLDHERLESIRVKEI